MEGSDKSKDLFIFCRLQIFALSIETGAVVSIASLLIHQQQTTVNMHPSIAGLVVSAASLLGYSRGSNEACFLGMCSGRGFYVVTSCAFNANPSSVFKVACSSRAFLPSVYRNKQLPAIRSATAGLLTRRAASTSSIEPRSENEETVFEQQTNPKGPNERLVIIIGGTGFLGTEIRHQLQERGVNYIATTTPATFRNMKEKDKFVPLDLTAENAQQDFYDTISSAMKDDGTSAKEVAVIAAMGTIGTKDDEKVNAALAEAIKGAHRVNAENDKRRLARRVSFLKGYADGKDEAEATLQDLFGENACIIKVRYIWGLSS